TVMSIAMSSISSIPSSALDLIAELAHHLAVELDLHYDEIDTTIHGEELDVLGRAVLTLRAGGHPLPDALTHVLARGAGKVSGRIL
ncbi:hypothetical protein AB9K41_30190, partial [Cribrihabitans sp. XS_ASV171]